MRGKKKKKLSIIIVAPSKKELEVMRKENELKEKYVRGFMKLYPELTRIEAWELAKNYL